jgi:hypothetical protein
LWRADELIGITTGGRIEGATGPDGIGRRRISGGLIRGRSPGFLFSIFLIICLFYYFLMIDFFV